MVILILIGIFAVVFFWSFAKSEGNDPGWLTFCCLFTVLVAGIISIVLIGVVLALTAIWSPNKEYINEKSIPIVSLRDGTGQEGNVNGSFLGVSGSFNSRLSYVWYERLPDGALRGRQILSNNSNEVEIFESAKPQTAHIERISGYTQTETPEWLFPWQIHAKEFYRTLWRIDVPKGSVIRGYVLNGSPN